MESQGRDIKLDEKRVEGYRNFATKLWNAARFCQANGIGASNSVAAPKAELAVNRWIIGEVVETLAKLNQAIADLRFDAMADTIYHFAWGTFCDWYLELIKPSFIDGEKQEIEAESKAVAGWVLDQILVMLHPFMPFITEELWGSMGPRATGLIHAKWPKPEATAGVICIIDGEAVDARAYFDWIISTIVAVRAARNEIGISPGQRLSAHLEEVTTNLWECLPDVRSLFERVGRINICESQNTVDSGALRISVPGATLVVSLEGAVDLSAERTRITNAIIAITKERDTLAGRLNNPAFVEKAKPEAVEKARSDMAEKSAEVERLQAALARLG
jgi:valyl-tRNA synthetase